MSDEEKFDVVQYFPNGSWEYVLQDATVSDAFARWAIGIESPAAKIGAVVRLIIIGNDDTTNADWRYGKGIVYPTPEDIVRYQRQTRAG